MLLNKNTRGSVWYKKLSFVCKYKFMFENCMEELST